MSFLDRSIRQPDPARAAAAGASASTDSRQRSAPQSVTAEETETADQAETADRMQSVQSTNEPQLLKTRDIPTATRNKPIDYNEVLQDLIARRGELETAMRAIRRIVGQ